MMLGDLNSSVQKNETRSLHYTNTKINSRWVKDLNISLDTIKVIEENISRKTSGIASNNIFIDMSPRARDIKEGLNKWDLIKIKSFFIAKENSIKMKREPTRWENILPMISQTRM